MNINNELKMQNLHFLYQVVVPRLIMQYLII